MIFNMSGGGAALNFKVVGNPQPENPSENTIWINTDAEITSWTFSVSEPENPVNGDVWITIGTSSTVAFNALKNNGIMVYPISARQYIDGAWIGVTAQSYQGNAWVEWLPVGALYWHGNECFDLTGGWTSKAWQMQSDATTNGQTFEIARNTDHIMFTKTGDTGAVLYAVNPIDLTNVKTIHFKGEMKATKNNYWVAFYVWTKMGGRYWNTNAAAKVLGESNNIKREFSLDVSSLEGEHFIGFGIYSEDNHVKLEELRFLTE